MRNGRVEIRRIPDRATIPVEFLYSDSDARCSYAAGYVRARRDWRVRAAALAWWGAAFVAGAIAGAAAALWLRSAAL